MPFGMKAKVNINVSNTCVLDVLFGKIDYMFTVNVTTGELVLRVPKYWMYEFRKYILYFSNLKSCMHIFFKLLVTFYLGLFYVRIN